MDKNFGWMSSKIFSTYDLNNGNLVSINFDSGISFEDEYANLNPGRISISIKDIKKNIGAKISYEITQRHLYDFMRNLIMTNCKEFVQENKFSEFKMFNGKVEKAINLKANPKFCEIKISDPGNNSFGVMACSISNRDFYYIFNDLLPNIYNNWITLNQNIISNSLLKMTLQELKINNNTNTQISKKISGVLINNNKVANTEDINNTKKIMTDIIDSVVTKENIEAIFSETQIEEEQEEDSELLNEFNNAMDNVDETEVDYLKEISDVKLSDKKQPNIEDSSIFIGKFLDYSFEKFEMIVTKFIFLDEESHPSEFNPLSEIYNVCFGLSDDKITSSQKYMKEYFYICMLKDIKNKLLNKQEIKPYPIFIFENIELYDENDYEIIDKFIVELLTLTFHMQIYTVAIKNNIKDDKQNILNDFYTYTYYLKTIMFSIMFSLLIWRDRELSTYKDDVIKYYDIFQKYDNIKNPILVYVKEATLIENDPVTKSMFLNNIEKFILQVEQLKTYETIEIDTFCEPFGNIKYLDSVNKIMDSFESVRDAFKTERSKEDQIKEKKMKLLLKTCKEEDEGFYEKIKHCSWDDILKILTSNKPSNNVIRSIRILNTLPDNKITMKNLVTGVKELNEDIIVTEAKIFQKPVIKKEEVEEINDEELDLIEKELFS